MKKGKWKNENIEITKGYISNIILLFSFIKKYFPFISRNIIPIVQGMH